MTRRRRFSDSALELPRLRDQFSGGVRLLASPWFGRTSASDHPHPHIRCGLTLGIHPTIRDVRDDGCWIVHVERSVVLTRNKESGAKRKTCSRSFAASIGWYADGFSGNPTLPLYPMLTGACSNWQDAIEQVGLFAPIVECVRRFGAEVYGSRDEWRDVRPFDVVYPYKSWPDEPNARYSPFKFKGGSFVAEWDGAVASLWRSNAAAATRLAQGEYRANAILWGPDDDSKYRLYHRDHMMSYDEIDIDDWRARIIAGTQDD